MQSKAIGFKNTTEMRQAEKNETKIPGNFKTE